MLAHAPQDVTEYRLAAIRHAGASFSDEATLRNALFETFLRERAELLETLEGLRGPLVDALFEVIPSIEAPKGRRRLLKLKRNIFNGRPTATIPAEVPPALVADVEHYQELLRRSIGLLDQYRPEIMQESRRRLAELTRRPDVATALGAVAPDLVAELHRRAASKPQTGKADRADHTFSNQERALYSYGARRFSKANPLHLFAALQVPRARFPRFHGSLDGATNDRVTNDRVTEDQDAPHEIILNTAELLDLERQLLRGTPAPEQVHLALPPHARHQDGDQDLCLFWCVGPDGLKIRAAAWTSGLDAVLSFFSAPNAHDLTLAAWTRHLSSLDVETRQAASEAFARLGAQQVVTRYLVTDLTDLRPLAGAAQGADEDLRRRCETALELHLARVDTKTLVQAEARLTGAANQDSGKGTASHFVNSYRDEDPRPFDRAAATVARELQELKPIFVAAGHNFSLNDAVLRAYLKEYLCRGNGAAPFLEILTHFRARQAEIVQQYRPGEGDAASLRQRQADAWNQKLADLDGELDSVTVRHLVDRRPVTGSTSTGLCFNGPYDFEQDLFTVSNIFDGHGHFTSRYELARAEHLHADGPDGPLDVELAVPPVPNLNFVAPAFATATGMEPRYRHRYAHWLDPADIEIALGEGGEEELIYRRTSDGRILRMHYRGFMLAEFLPAEHQLLLLGHGDTYRNPFLRSEGRPGAGDLRHDPELRYGGVRLRRECWALSHDLLQTAPRHDDILQFAVQFRDWLHETLGVGAEQWFYRTLGGRKGSYKPRYLDLRNPLAAQAFRRSFMALPKTAALSFTVLDPAPDGLLEGRMRELMIEV